MAWSDEPTEAQLDRLWVWIRWFMPDAEASSALAWLQKNATRKQVSEEMNRLHDLKEEHKLNREECFKGEIWKGYFKQSK